MKIVAVETLRPAVQPNLLLVQLHGDDGNIGLGEAFYGASTVDEYVHTAAAPALLALDDVTPEKAAAALAPYCGYGSGGAEVRGNGAIDVALWDLLAKTAGLPLVRLLGGPVREQVRVYNTCAGTRYVSQSTRQRSENWGLDTHTDRYEDLHAFLTNPRKLTRALLDEGITAMKVWPFDLGAEATDGLDISRDDLAYGVGVIAAIREEAGDAMDVMVELHGLWSPRAAQRICAALEPYQPFWVEDPLRPDMVDALADLRARIRIPIATGETLTGRRAFLPLLQAKAADVLTVDIGWTGGLTEARKIASLADTYAVAIAPHDCTGPVSLAVAATLCLSQPNGLIQETTRAFIRTWYGEIADGLPAIQDGKLTMADSAGHGVTLLPGFETDDRRVTAG